MELEDFGKILAIGQALERENQRVDGRATARGSVAGSGRSLCIATVADDFTPRPEKRPRAPTAPTTAAPIAARKCFRGIRFSDMFYEGFSPFFCIPSRRQGHEKQALRFVQFSLATEKVESGIRETAMSCNCPTKKR